MTSFGLPMFHKPSAETKEKAISVVCGVCIYAWGIAGVLILIGLVSSLGN